MAYYQRGQVQHGMPPDGNGMMGATRRASRARVSTVGKQEQGTVFEGTSGYRQQPQHEAYLPPTPPPQQQGYYQPAPSGFQQYPPHPPLTVNPREIDVVKFHDISSESSFYPEIEERIDWAPGSGEPREPDLAARFALGQEVFILDTQGSDPSGLTTYHVISNFEVDPGDGGRLYRLLPSREVAFRVGEVRLLEAGSHPLGSQVRKKGGKSKSVVTRRYVVKGVRYYDLRDERGKTVVKIKEGDVQGAEGGVFPFVMEVRKDGGV